MIREGRFLGRRSMLMALLFGLLLGLGQAGAETAHFTGANDGQKLEDWVAPPARGAFSSDASGLLFTGGEGADSTQVVSMLPSGVSCGSEVGARVVWELDLNRTDTVAVVTGGMQPDVPTVRFLFGPQSGHFVVLHRAAEDSDTVWVKHRWGEDISVSARFRLSAERTDPGKLLWRVDGDLDGVYESPLGESNVDTQASLGTPAIAVPNGGFRLGFASYTVRCDSVDQTNEVAEIPEPEFRIEVDPSEVHQEIDGFGGSVAFYRGLIYRMSEPSRSEVVDLLFDDLGATLIRMLTWHGIEPQNDDGDPEHIEWSGFDFSGDAPQIWTVQQALARGIDTVMATSWSPPGWMKTTGSAVGGPDRETGQLLTPETTPPSAQADPEFYYREFAEWMTAYALKYEEQHGIHIDYLSIQNEANLRVSYEGMHVNPEEFHLLTRLLHERFEREGVTSEIMMPENNGPRSFPGTYDTISHMLPTLEDPVTRPYVGMLATHQATSVGEMRYLTELAAGYGLHVWQTEHHLANVGGGGMDAALELARDLHEGVVLSNVNAYFTWCYAWIPDEQKTSGLISIPEPPNRDQYTVTKPYYAFKQYSREVRPGSHRVGAISHDPRLRVGAFRDAERLILTVINDRSLAIEASIGIGGSPQLIEVRRTSETEDYAEAPAFEVIEGGFRTSFSPRSITTAVLRSEDLPDLPPADAGAGPGAEDAGNTEPPVDVGAGPGVDAGGDNDPVGQDAAGDAGLGDAPSSPTESVDEGGCGCGIGGGLATMPTSPWLLGFLLVGLGRRRRGRAG